MNGKFEAVSYKSQSLINEIAALNPENPFYTNQYFNYRLARGFTPWIFMYECYTQSKIYCPAFMKTGHLRCSLEIPSMPEISTDELFWSELINFCRKKGVSDLSVNSFCSQGGIIPQLNYEINRKPRWEYVLDLTHPDVFIKMRKGHAYSIKRARKAGAEIRRTCDKEAVSAHAQLISTSMQRRQNRGENVTTSVSIKDFLQLTESGVGEIFQAVLADRIVSSNLILIAETAGYNHTQGTSPEGMDCGAAHFLIHEIACILRQEGKKFLNLGGTDDPNQESGLVKFKTGFGIRTKRIELETAQSKPSNVAYSKLLRFFNSVK
jgi:lipid II:glycine glycyltransferase (peptidoglycan interpeptide bridge formation enzyme)